MSGPRTASDPASPVDIVIAGGGFAGLAVAIALGRAFNGCMRIAVVDPGPIDPVTPGPADARASALGAGSRQMLEQLGIWTELTGYVQDVSAVDLTDSGLDDAVRPVLLSYATAMEDGSPGMSVVPNTQLRLAFQRVARRTAGITLLAGTHVETVTATPAAATVLLSRGLSLRTPLVIAADGRKSPLREAAGITSVGWHYPQAGIVTTVTFERPHQGRAVQHFLPGGPFAILPLPGNRACITWTETTDEAHRLMASDAATFAAAVDQRAGGKLGAVTVDGPRQSWPLDVFLARTLVSERLALIGDAARAVHPLAGQGLNLGLRDAAALIEVIADAARCGQDVGSAGVLAEYERWRRADGALSAAAFDALNRLFSNDWAVLRTARGAGLGLVDRLPTLKHWLVGEAAGTTGDVPRLLRGLAV